ncbi:MAG: O-antigen ligase family protein, partial [Nitrospinae bacterium]|nr:O-antigen ligase family protein [Nitrospinota bacterium]
IIIFSGVILFYLIKVSLISKEEIRIVVVILILSFLITLTLGFIEQNKSMEIYKSIYVYLPNTHYGHDGRLMSPFTNVNEMATYIIMLFPLIILLNGEALFENKSLSFILSFLMLAAVFLAIYGLLDIRSSNSIFTLFFVLFIGTIFYFLKGYRFIQFHRTLLKRMVTLFTFFAFLSILFISVVDRNKVFDINHFSLRQGGSVSHFFSTEYLISKILDKNRRALWQKSLEVWSENPIMGVGIGAYKALDGVPKSMEFHDEVLKGMDPHNYYLLILSQLGLLGFIPFIGIVFIIIFQGKASLEKMKNPLEQKIMYGIWLGLIGLLFSSVGDHILGFIEVQFLFWSMLGILFSMNSLEVEHE